MTGPSAEKSQPCELPICSPQWADFAERIGLSCRSRFDRPGSRWIEIEFGQRQLARRSRPERGPRNHRFRRREFR